MSPVEIIALPLRVLSRKKKDGTICKSTDLIVVWALVSLRGNNPFEPRPSNEILLPLRCFSDIFPTGTLVFFAGIHFPPLWGDSGAINWVNLHPAVNATGFVYAYPLDSDLSSRWCHSLFEQSFPRHQNPGLWSLKAIKKTFRIQNPWMWNPKSTDMESRIYWRKNRNRYRGIHECGIQNLLARKPESTSWNLDSSHWIQELTGQDALG